MDFYQGELGQKRAGSLAPTTSGAVPGFSTWLFRHVPGNDDGAAELWSDDGIVFRRLVGGTVWTTVSIVDSSLASTGVTGASFNAKLFLTTNSSVNRLHVFDGTNYRRVGMAQGGTPTAANTGGGAYAATLRYYKVAWVDKTGTVINRRGELGPSLSFTPSGAGTAARVTQPSVPSENETHWEIYGSLDDVYSNYKLIGTVVVGTTTYDDSVNPASYVGDAPQIAGINIPPPSARYIISATNRLLMAGAWETTAAAGQTAVKNNRVWFTRVLGSSDQGDDETIPNTSAVGIIPAQKNWIDVGENDGGAITGLRAFVGGVVYVFKQRQLWKLIPTGDDIQPYRVVQVSNRIGSNAHHSIVEGEDETGAQALYFYSHRGPYRLTADGTLQYCGRDIEDMSRAATPSIYIDVWAIYWADRRQVWFFIPGTEPNPLAIFNVTQGRMGEFGVRGGWARYSVEDGFSPHCGVMFSNTLGATMSNDLRPYLGIHDTPGIIGTFRFRKYGTGTADGNFLFQAYIDSKPFFPAGIGTNCRTDDAVLIAEDAAGVSIQLTTTRDFGLETRTSDVVLTPADTETHVMKRFEASGLAELGAVQFRLGDAAAVSNAWTLEALSVPFSVQESRS